METGDDEITQDGALFRVITERLAGLTPDDEEAAYLLRLLRDADAQALSLGDTRAQALALMQQGMTMSEAATRLGITRQRVHQLVVGPGGAREATVSQRLKNVKMGGGGRQLVESLPEPIARHLLDEYARTGVLMNRLLAVLVIRGYHALDDQANKAEAP